jgi:hypothetical protein
MLENYKVLGAMIALSEFTVNDLSQYSGVKPNTVRTTINREQIYLEEIGKQETGKRGGQHRRWRLKASQIGNLRLRIDKLFSHLKTKPSALPETGSAPQVPLGLLVAEDFLLRLFPEADNSDKKKEILESAKINFDTGRAECENLIFGPDHTPRVEAIRAHMHSIQGLLVLSEAELGLENNKGQVKFDFDIQELHQQLTTASKELWKLGGGNCAYAFDTMQRLAESPLVYMALTY